MDWISVKDRLPEKNGLYLVLYNYKDWPYPFRVAVRRFWTSEPHRWGKVGHWMPLPEPPKEV